MRNPPCALEPVVLKAARRFRAVVVTGPHRAGGTWLLLLALLVTLFTVSVAAGQDPVPPPRGEPTLSIGLPQTWRPELGAGFYRDHDDDGNHYGAELRASLFHPLLNPAAGVGLQVDALFRVVNGARPGGAVRLSIPVRYLGVSWGWEYDFRRETVQGVFSINLPLRRGGLFGQGDLVHIDWSGSTFRAAVTFPLRGRWMGTSRPSGVRASLPDPPRPRTDASIDRRSLDARLSDLRLAARWVDFFTAPFIDQWSTNGFIRGVHELRAEIGSHDALFPAGHTFTGAIEAYHRELVRALTWASGGDAALGETVSASAREILLEDVILPYDRLLGRIKRYDSLHGLGAGASERFARSVTRLVPRDRAATVRAVFDAVVDMMEQNRRESHAKWGDSRRVWIPLHYALRLEDHDSQAEINAIMERALDRPFTDGNEISYVIDQQFHIEVARQIREARDYHVLWIHDFKGKNAAGDPDEVGFTFVTDVYLRALIDSVRAYDERGVLPQYIIILDQYFYAGSDAKRWMKVLQDPMDHVVHLPAAFEAWDRKLRGVQQELRDAVAGSRRLQAGLRAYGRDWLKNQVKVHVNITNPEDPSFTSPYLLPLLPAVPDDMMRDHRKIAFYDVTEADPAKGGVLFAGMGIAEHYASRTWEDRAVLVRGPAALAVKAEARAVLLRQGFTEDEIPRALKPLPRPDDYDARVEAMRRARGIFNVHAVQVHNGTGFDQKWSTVARALLYDLMPAGSTILVPDSLWNNPLWAAMLVGNALRGGRVFAIAPSPKNAPGAGALVMSRANEIFTRLLVVRLELSDEIERAGGSLRVGIYNVVGPLDPVHELTTLLDNWRDPDPALRASFPFDPSVVAAVRQVRDELVASGYEPAPLPPDAVKRDPLIHMKSQIMISRELIDGLVPRPEMAGLVQRYIRLRAQQLATLRGSALSLEEQMQVAARTPLIEWWTELPAEAREHALGFLTVGSHNMDIRGQIMDGEVCLVVAGEGALSAYLNFAYVAGVTTWVDSVEELRTLLPQYNVFTKWLARYAKNAL